jgi:hypothetical protein
LNHQWLTFLHLPRAANQACLFCDVFFLWLDDRPPSRMTQARFSFNHNGQRAKTQRIAVIAKIGGRNQLAVSVAHA